MILLLFVLSLISCEDKKIEPVVYKDTIVPYFVLNYRPEPRVSSSSSDDNMKYKIGELEDEIKRLKRKIEE
jgi:hypothetical protein